MPIYWGCIYISIETWNYTRELYQTNEGVKGRNKTSLYGKIKKPVFMGRNKTSLYGKKQNQSFSGETKQIFMGKKQNQFYEITLMSQITNETNVNGNK